MDIMTTRKRQWKALHDLKPERPMIIFEPFWLDGFMDDYKLLCEDPILRNVELRMALAIRQFEMMGDDVVLEPYFRIAWWGKDLVSTVEEVWRSRDRRARRKGEVACVRIEFPHQNAGTM